MFAKEARRERRKQHRFFLHPPIAFSVGDGPVLHAHCRDISLGGAFVETATPALFGARVRVHLWVDGPESGPPLAIDSIVRWTNRDGFGVQFMSLGVRETHALVALFQRGSALREVSAAGGGATRPDDTGPRKGLFRASRARLQAYRRRLRALLERFT